jgi:hypothetical protein
VAGEREWRQRVEREHTDLEHLRAGGGPAAVCEPGLVGDSNHAGSCSLGDVIDADEACHLDLGADLFEALASGRIPWIFVVVDEPAWKAPLAAARLDRAATQQDAAVDLDHDRRCDLGVVPEHEIVVWTALDLTAFDHSRKKLGATVDAVVGHPPNSSDASETADRARYACCFVAAAFMSATRTWLRPPCLAA